MEEDQEGPKNNELRLNDIFFKEKKLTGSGGGIYPLPLPLPLPLPGTGNGGKSFKASCKF